MVKLAGIKQNLIYLLIFIAILFFSILLLFSGKDDAIYDDVKELKFSRESGFYDKDFDLSIRSLGGTIFYTLDGSIPTCESIRYDGPIHITDASKNENVYADRIDIGPANILNVLTDNSLGDLSYLTPQNKLDKCTVVRAVVYYGNGIYSKVKTASYFVGFDDKPGYEKMNIISLVTDPDNLFDYENGIYINGKAFADEIERVGKEELVDDNLSLIISNYQLRGMDNEREADCQFFDENRELLLAQNCGMRIHGGLTRALFQKSFNIYARQKYDGRNTFMRCFFDNDYNPQKLTLTQGGNDDMCKINDWLVNSLVSELDFSTMQFSPYVLFLDGEYWGVYWLTEKYDKNYIRYYYRTDTDGIVIVKNEQLEEGKDSDFESYEELMGFCASKDMATEPNYRELCNLIDIDSYIDYYASMIYISRCEDWPGTNEALWKTRKNGKGQYEDSKWRWMLFDVNFGAMDIANAEFDTIEYLLNVSPMFSSLFGNPEFRNKLLDRIEELSGTVFDCNNVQEKINEFRQLMDEPMLYSNKRFYGEDSYDKYLTHIEEVSTFFEKRGDYVENMIKKYR